jgi:hypothetical protein
MSELSRDEVIAAVGPISDAAIAEIIATGVTREELAKACAFVDASDVATAGREIPVGRIGHAISIIERVKSGAASRSLLGEGGSNLE